MTRAAFLADTAAVLVCLLLLCCAMPAQAGCEVPKRKPLTVYKPKPQQVCTCRPMQQAGPRAKTLPQKRFTAKEVQPLARREMACPEPAPVREVSAPGAGGGGGLRLAPFTPPAPVVLAEMAQEPLTVVQDTQVPDEPQSWRGGPILIPPGPLPMFEPLPVVFVPVPAVPEPHGLALFGVGLVFLWGVRKCKK